MSQQYSEISAKMIKDLSSQSYELVVNNMTRKDRNLLEGKINLCMP